jgi:hypothetical protein
VNHSERGVTAIIRDVGGAREGAASVTAETTPHGPPSHSAIMAAQESNAIPTGPRITQAVRRANVSDLRLPLLTATIVTCATVGASGLSPASTSDRDCRPASNRARARYVAWSCVGPGRRPESEGFFDTGIEHTELAQPVICADQKLPASCRLLFPKSLDY